MKATKALIEAVHRAIEENTSTKIFCTHDQLRFWRARLADFPGYVRNSGKLAFPNGAVIELEVIPFENAAFVPAGRPGHSLFYDLAEASK